MISKLFKIKNLLFLKLFKYILLFASFPFISVAHSQNYFFETGVKYLDNKNYDSAIYYLNLSLDNDTEYYDAYYYRAIGFFFLDSNYSSIDDINKYLLRNPSDIKGILWKGLIYEKLELYDEAIENYKIAVDADIKSIYKQIGLCYYKKDDYRLAIQSFDSAIKYRKELQDSYYYKTICYSKLDNLDSACISLCKLREAGYYYAEELMYKYCDCDSTKVNEAIAKGYITEALDFMDEDKYDAALIRLRFSLELMPNYHESIFHIGLCYYYQNKFDSALKNINDAIILSPLCQYYCYRGMTNYQLMQEYFVKHNKQLKEKYKNDAIKDFETYIGMDTTNYFGYSYLGWVYFFNKNDMIKAYKYFVEADKLHENHIDIIIGLTLTAYCLNNYDAAKKYYEKACCLEPGLKKNEKGLEFLEKQGYIYNDFEKSVFHEMYSYLFK